MVLEEDKMIMEWEVKEGRNITLDLAIVTEIIIAAMLFLKHTHTKLFFLFQIFSFIFPVILNENQ